MTKTNKIALTAVLASFLAFYGCDETPPEVDAGPGTDAGMRDGGPPGTDAGPDAGGDTDAGADAPTCADYCTIALDACPATGANGIYADADECMAICEGFGWAAGDPVTVGGPAAGNTIGCRTYHAGVASAEMPELHCPHAGPTGAETCGSNCENYCTAALAACTGADAIYADMGECMTACAPLDATGDIGAVAGDTLQCRFYHLGVAVTSGDTALHCPHASAGGGGTCVGGWDFRTEGFISGYTQVDNMGMPAVATALVLTGESDKNDYNDYSPVVNEENANLVASLSVLHNSLNDDLTGLSLTPCAVDGEPGTAGFQADVTPCLTQEVAAGVSVLSLVNPDTLTMDISSTATFPNGRALTDPVIDVTLAILLLDLGTHAATGLVGVLNPDENDVDYLTTFPYLAPPHQPAP